MWVAWHWWHVYVCIYIHTHIHTHILTYLHTHTHTHTHGCSYIHLYLHTFAYCICTHRCWRQRLCGWHSMGGGCSAPMWAAWRRGSGRIAWTNQRARATGNGSPLYHLTARTSPHHHCRRRLRPRWWRSAARAVLAGAVGRRGGRPWGRRSSCGRRTRLLWPPTLPPCRCGAFGARGLTKSSLCDGCGV